MLSIYVIFLMFLASTVLGDAEYSLPEGCTDIKPLTSIDYHKAAGEWITTLETENIPAHCDRFNQSVTGDPAKRGYNAVFYIVPKATNIPERYNIYTQILDAKNPAAPYLEYVSGYPKKYSPFVTHLFVLAADYEKFFLFYGCFPNSTAPKKVTEFYYLDTRSITVDQDVKDQVRTALENNGLKYEALTNGQADCKNYIPKDLL